MASYHVFIERPRELGGAAVAKLAEAVAARYGLPAPALIARLGAGRLRVKASVDRAAAETLAADLEQMGAVCSIVDAETGAKLEAPPPVRVRAQTPSPFASGLSAASNPGAPQDLGALSTGEFSLSTLDGKSDRDPDERSHEGLPASFGPPAETLPASIGPAIVAAERPVERGGSSAAAPLDLFAPPDAHEAPPELALDVDPRERRGGTTAAAPPPPVAGRGTISADPEMPSSRSSSGVADWIRDRRIRLAAGVALAILLGFVPATVVASLRERSDFERVDAEVTLHYKGVKTLEQYRKLDPWLDTQLAHKRDVQHGIALGSMLIWALAGAGVAFVWFRKIDWDRVANRFES